MPALCRTLLERIAHESGLPVRHVDTATLARLAAMPLLGNVRELENILHRALALSDGDALELPEEAGVITPSISTHAATPAPHVGESMTKQALPDDLQAYLDEKERGILVRALRETGFNRTLAAKQLGLTLRQIRYRIARLRIDAPEVHGEDSDE